ncbi:hypothetical protein AVEN_56364-1 [Araneus ventricosus]|uniref:Uncharacterized protein n=1 Tax=Araneus ventricosus TaxID=182803 RepID=A0A4Y2LRD7_ARAVE|nr:hypothetical protein AVEN_56364-1 [Araneus ventricosus]
MVTPSLDGQKKHICVMTTRIRVRVTAPSSRPYTNPSALRLVGTPPLTPWCNITLSMDCLRADPGGCRLFLTTTVTGDLVSPITCSVGTHPRDIL